MEEKLNQNDQRLRMFLNSDYWQHRAEKLIENPQKVSKVVEQAFYKAKLNKVRERLEEHWLDLMSLLKMIQAWSRGEYKEVPWQSLILSISGIIYFLNPIDFIPDFLAFWGLSDDIIILSWIISSIKDDIEKFRNWSETKESVS